MSKKISVAIVLALFVGVTVGVVGSAGAEGDDAKPKFTTKEVMKVAHKDGLLKKILAGEASEGEKAKLLELYVAMYENKPKKGDKESWTKLTANSVVAAAKVVLKEKGAESELKKATDCKGCHKSHK